MAPNCLNGPWQSQHHLQEHAGLHYLSKWKFGRSELPISLSLQMGGKEQGQTIEGWHTIWPLLEQESFRREQGNWRCKRQEYFAMRAVYTGGRSCRWLVRKRSVKWGKWVWEYSRLWSILVFYAESLALTRWRTIATIGLRQRDGCSLGPSGRQNRNLKECWTIKSPEPSDRPTGSVTVDITFCLNWGAIERR